MNRARAIAFADTIAQRALAMVAAANLLFVLSFLAVLAFATWQAKAEEIVCAGKDMMAEFAKSDPAAYATIRAEADATPNGRGLLWKIEKDGAPASYLFGTMHMTDPRVLDLPAAAKSAYEAADTVVIEALEVLDPAAMMAVIAARPELTMFTDATTLSSLLEPGEAKVMNDALAARGIPPASVAKMKPWMLSAMVALPACEFARKAKGAEILDIRLARDAKAAGKEIAGLETIESQLEAMASLPMKFHMKGLVETLKLGAQTEDVIETMVSLYDAADLGAFWPLFRKALPPGEDDELGYAAFEETMITARNRGMAETARGFIDAGNAFIAVGALHLPGEAGVVELLRGQGYTVTRAD